jgi:molybdopterin/thiamine biosynthesis adenylyltransferase
VSSSERYARQIRLPQIGTVGQERLQQSRVALVGLGALGSVSADALCRAGVGTLVLIDRDIVELSNLQRQTLYTQTDAERGELKALAAAERLRAINPDVELVVHPDELHCGNAASLLEGCDLLLDGSDNFAVRYLLNDYAVAKQVPFVYAGVVSTYGMSGAILPGQACLRCLWPEPPALGETETCSTAGVLGPAVSVVAGWASSLAMRALLDPDFGAEFTSIDPWHSRVHHMRGVIDPACPCCQEQDHPWLEGRRDAPTAEAACAGNAVRLPGAAIADLEAVALQLEGAVENLQCTPAFLRFEVGEHEVLLFASGHRLVRGTSDPARARTVLAATIGH